MTEPATLRLIFDKDAQPGGTFFNKRMMYCDSISKIHIQY
nr:MAG TPA: hypothetical protein [Caudoviricetes sp.]